MSTTDQHSSNLAGIAPEVVDHSFRFFSRLIAGASSDQASRLRCESALLGYAGLIALPVLGFAIVLGVVACWPDDLNSPFRTSWLLSLVWGVIQVTLAMTLSLNTFISLMSDSRLTVRILIAMGLNGTVLLFSAIVFLFAHQLSDDLNVLGILILAFILGVAIVAISFQQWTSRTILPCRTDLKRPARLSILTLIELIGLVACFLAAWKAFTPPEDWILPLGVYAVVGVVLSLLQIPLIAGCFSATQPNRTLMLALVLVTLAASVLAGFAIMDDPASIAWGSLLTYSLLIGFAIAISFCALEWVAIWWLRGCGWSMIDRSTSTHGSRSPGAETTDSP